MGTTTTSTTTTPAPATEQLAHATFARLADAWNRADGTAFGAEFSDDTDFVNIDGEHHRGDREVIARGHDGIFSTIYAGSTVAYRVDVVRTLGPGVVAVVATSTLDAPAGPLHGTNHSRITAVLVDEGDRWAIQAFQNTLVRASRA
jgi:uncharacterized protein (TIGR02246 family)